MKCSICNEPLHNVEKIIENDLYHKQIFVCSKECLREFILKNSNVTYVGHFPVKYHFRSKLEEDFALFLERSNIPFLYEAFLFPDKNYYLPDFYIPFFGFMELKGIWNKGDKRKVKRLSEYHPIYVLTAKQLAQLKIYKGGFFG